MTLTEVMQFVVKETKVPREQIESESRKKQPSLARHIYCYLCKHYTTVNLSEIGRSIGRDHSTVLNSVKAINDMKDTDPDFADRMFVMEERIMGNKVELVIRERGVPPVTKREFNRERYNLDEDKPKTFTRPPAIYSNQQYSF